MKALHTDLGLGGHQLKKVGYATEENDAPNWSQTYPSKSISILDPQAGDKITLWHTGDTKIEVLSVFTSLLTPGGSGNVHFWVNSAEAGNRTADAEYILEDADAFGTEDGGSQSFNQSFFTRKIVNAPYVIWLEITDVTNTSEFHLTIYYRVIEVD